jgi:hypothetical protein
MHQKKFVAIFNLGFLFSLFIFSPHEAVSLGVVSQTGVSQTVSKRAVSQRAVAATSRAIKTSDEQKFPLLFRNANTPGLIAMVSVGAKHFQFLIDTGASAHSLSATLAKQFQAAHDGLQDDGVSGTTPYGPVRMSRLGSVPISIGGRQIKLQDVLGETAQSPGGLEEAGIMGVLSPAKLADHALVIIDAAEPALYLISPAPVDILNWVQARFKNFDFDPVPRLEKDSYRETVLASTDQFGPLPMFVDTGATTSHIYSTTQTTSDAPVSIGIGSHKCRTSKVLIHSSSGRSPPSHLLGMDCLGGKILVLAPKGQPLLWIGWPHALSELPTPPARQQVL